MYTLIENNCFTCESIIPIIENMDLNKFYKIEAKLNTNIDRICKKSNKYKKNINKCCNDQTSIVNQSAVLTNEILFEKMSIQDKQILNNKEKEKCKQQLVQEKNLGARISDFSEESKKFENLSLNSLLFESSQEVNENDTYIKNSGNSIQVAYKKLNNMREKTNIFNVRIFYKSLLKNNLRLKPSI